MTFEIFSEVVVENLGWTLLHSLWQIAFVSAWLFVALKLSGKATANFRYLLACAALFLTLALPVTTFVWLSSSTLKPTASVQNTGLDQERFLPNDRLGKEYFVADKMKDARLSEESGKNSRAENFRIYFADLFASRLPLLVLVWLVGVMFCALRNVGGFRQIIRLRKFGNSPASNYWQKRFAELCGKVGVSAGIRLRESALVAVPTVVGWLKPVVLIPGSAFLGMSAAQLETVIVHELMHIRRHDFLVNLMQTAIEILFFYHPCVRLISAAIRKEREFVCDDLVVAFYGERLNYAHALANLEQSRRQKSQMALAANGGNLLQRIRRIVEPKKDFRSARFSVSASALSFLLTIALLINISAAYFNPSVNTGSVTKSKKIAVGFVSIPPIDRTANPPEDADATARLLIERLKSHKVPAIGFLLGGAISDGEKLYSGRANIVRLWRDAGFEIGIGNFRHVWFYDTPYEEYVAGVEKNEAVARKILAEKNLPLRYFSYPFMNTGKNADERNRFEAWLKEKNITPVKYTIDNQEWMYSYAYETARAKNDLNEMNKIRREFLEYMTKMFDHFEAYSQEMFGRDISQTMVLTPSRLVADSSDDLFGMIEKRGYQFVSMEEALKDEAYQTPENFYGKSGISWFERWQMAKGKKLFDEPNVNAEVYRIWNDAKGKTK